MIRAFPHDPAFDNTIALLREGYSFIPNRCAALQSDVFTTRLMFKKVVCVSGEDAARMFYEPGRFTRRRSLPLTTLMLLQDFGSAQTLDGELHRQRKAMFMSLMTQDSIESMLDISAAGWRGRFEQWERRGTNETVLQKEAEDILCRAACQWAGLKLTDKDAARRTLEFAAMVEGAGSAGPRNWRGLVLRRETERWARAVIATVRAGKIELAGDSPVSIIARHRDADGRHLSTDVAAVELINLLRSIVAAARYVTFGALAMHQSPAHRRKVGGTDPAFLSMFVQEVRRFYPFFTAVGGRVLQEFEWRGQRFKRGTWVLLDIYGSHHDSRTWSAPGSFRPERFEGWTSSGFDLIAQGGGDYYQGHRCAGESLTIGLVQTALRLLATDVNYEVPPQDLRIDLGRMPAIPESRFVIKNVRVRMPA